MLKAFLHNWMLTILQQRTVERPLKDWERARFLNKNQMKIMKMIAKMEKDFIELIDDYIDKNIKS